jgi:hypothetical protein
MDDNEGVETVTHSVTLPVDLRNRGMREFAANNPSDMLRMAAEAGIRAREREPSRAEHDAVSAAIQQLLTASSVEQTDDGDIVLRFSTGGE